MTENWTPEEENLLRRALHAEAANVTPSSGGLDRILARTRREGGAMNWWRNPEVLGTAAAVAMASAAVAAALILLGGTDEPPVAGPGTDSPTPAETTEPTEPAAEPTEETTADPSPEPTDDPAQPTIEPVPGFEGAIPIYYVADTPAGLRLAREWRPVETTRTAADEAVASLFEPSLVPNYFSLWDPATEVRSVEVRDGAIKVDLSLPDVDPVAPDNPELAIQQLVYTATAVMAAQGEPTEFVRILSDGAEIDEIGGVDVSEVIRRAPQLEVRQLVQLNDPFQDAEVANPVEVTGDAAVFEANLLWEVLQDGQVVQDGHTSTAEGQTFSPFRFVLDLPPGDYQVVIMEDDPSGGEEGFGPMTDSRDFTVTD